MSLKFVYYVFIRSIELIAEGVLCQIDQANFIKYLFDACLSGLFIDI